MELRSIEKDSLLTVITEEGTTSVLISNQPQDHPEYFKDNIVLVPSLALVTLLAHQRSPELGEITVMQGLTQHLLGEIKDTCDRGSECDAHMSETGTYLPQTRSTVQAMGIVCAQAAIECRDCPLNLRPGL